MSAKIWLDQVCLRLLTHRVPLGYVRRVRSELADHLEDLGSSESRPLEGLMGDPESLSTSLIQGYCYLGWLKRHPGVAFLISPTVVFLISTYCTIRTLDSLMPASVSLEFCITVILVLLLAVPTILHMLYAVLAYQCGRSSVWPVVSYAQVTLFACLTVWSVSVDSTYAGDDLQWFPARQALFLQITAIVPPLAGLLVTFLLATRHQAAIRELTT